jgi:DMSO/TMAO reductase YedYZ molybdopterin-dependent catalytic subunit
MPVPQTAAPVGRLATGDRTREAMMVSRRTTIQQLVLAGAGLSIAPDALFAGAQSGVGEPVPFEDIPANFSTRRTGNFTHPGEEVTGLDLRNLTWKVRPSDTFVVSHYNTPVVGAEEWRLQIDGDLNSPQIYTLDALKRRARVERTVMFECGGNREAVLHRMVSNTTWAGCSLRALLDEAAPRNTVQDVVFWGSDQGDETIRTEKYTMNFARSISMADALASDAILAYEMDGAPLPVVHGFPVRLIVPGWYGVTNVKWLKRIELSPRRFLGRFMGRDYVTIMGQKKGDRIEYTETSVTRMLVKSVIARVGRPVGGSGPFVVSGAAWTDGTPLETVEIQVDGGPWEKARLERQITPSRHAWTFFTADIASLAPGPHTVASRATDRRGATQPVDLALKKSNWENNAIWVRKIRV